MNKHFLQLPKRENVRQTIELPIKATPLATATDTFQLLSHRGPPPDKSGVLRAKRLLRDRSERQLVSKSAMGKVSLTDRSGRNLTERGLQRVKSQLMEPLQEIRRGELFSEVMASLAKSDIETRNKRTMETKSELFKDKSKLVNRIFFKQKKPMSSNDTASTKIKTFKSP